MPCNTIQTVSVDIGKLDPTLVMHAIKSAGLLGRVVYAGGRLTMRNIQDQESTTQTFKRAYAAEVVKSQAKKYGWLIKQTGEFQYEVTKR